ncbi:MAG: F0F1 ATP synthase subunit B [Drouetiella hepatica Uher 2000/2452]|jgi:F-type H+-transporting ATPase subunit b|uniref:ATP synthase subunit b n=1 Tax=Drouetiella hepatica Uher 2000/2452 TaxID=904376 RepID=A0A951Q8L4_9CYAN|nr:F0F1 ATP synthase subunit B [Drouetiella hepatica Uher 2000/2452]
MESFILLAAKTAEVAETAERGGFGLNFNLLESNIINLAIIIGVLIYFGRGFLGKTLSERRSKIEEAIKDAEQRKQKAAAALADQQQKLAQAQTEAARIRSEAEGRAEAVRGEVLAQAQTDIERMRASAAQDLNTQQEKIISEVRQRIAALAVQRAESQLRSGLDPETQQQLIERSIATIGGS